MTTLFCVHPHGFNIGNHAIHLALRHLLSEVFGRVVNVISVPATSRFETHGRAGLTASMIHEMNLYGDGVIVGGGNLFENGQLDLDLDALPALEPPLMLMSLSRGRIYNRSGELVDRTDVMPDRKIIALHEKADVSLLRDRATLEHAHRLGCAGARLGGCPTITLGEIAGRLPAAAAPDAGGVLLSVRNPSLMNIPLSAQSRVHEQVRDLIRLLSSRGRVRLLCHDHRDLPFAASFPGTRYVYTDDVSQYLSLIRAADLVVTYRLHSLIPAAAFGTPAVSISYDERAISAIQTIGLGDWDITLMDGDVPAAVESRLARLNDFDRLCAEAEPVWADLRHAMTGGLSIFRDAVADYSNAEDEGAARCNAAATISISSLKPERITAAG